MAYDPSIPPSLRLPYDRGGSIWAYISSLDSHSIISASAYFSNARLIGVLVGDIIIVYSVIENLTKLYMVTSFSGTGANLSPISSGGGGGSGSVITQPTSLVLTSGNTGNTYANTGASGAVIYSLPVWALGLSYASYVATAQSIEFLCNGTDKIANGSDQSAAGGNVTSATVGNYVQLVATTPGIWATVNILGDWTLT